MAGPNRRTARPAGRQPSLQVNKTSKAAFSYYTSRPKTSSGGSWRQTGWLRNLPSLIALTALTFSLIYSLSLSTKPRLTMTDLTGNKLRSKQTYQQGAQALLSSSPLNRTKFTIDIRSFEADFKKQFPEVSDVSVVLPLIGRRPVMNIVMAKPVMLLTSRGQVYVLDKNGHVIMHSNDLDAGLRSKLPVVNDQSGLATGLGKTVLPSQSVEYITTVLAQLSAKQLTVKSIVLPAVPQQLNITIANQPYYVKFDLNTNAKQAVGAYLAVRQYLQDRQQTPQAYVDVRVPGRAYYK